jgi:hypothetical protein
MENLNGNWEGMGLVLRDLRKIWRFSRIIFAPPPSYAALETIIVAVKSGNTIC